MADLTITWADVTTAFPNDTALAALPTDTQDDILADVVLEVSVTNFGGQARALAAGKFLAAHLGTIRAVGVGSTPALQSISVGSVSKTFAVSVAVDSFALDGTSYGKEYRRRVRMAPRNRFVVLEE